MISLTGICCISPVGVITCCTNWSTPFEFVFNAWLLPCNCITCGWLPVTVVEVLVVIFDVLFEI